MFILKMPEHMMAIAPIDNANKFPFSTSIVFQTTTIVKVPKRAGKNFIQKTPFPNCKIIQETQEVTGGTE